MSPGVKTQGGIVSHLITDVEVSCLPKDLPEFLEIDLSHMSLNDTKFLADIPLPQGVTIPELAHRNPPVVSIHSPRAEEPEPVAADGGRRLRWRGALRHRRAAAGAAGCGALRRTSRRRTRQEGGSGQEGGRQEVATGIRLRVGAAGCDARIFAIKNARLVCLR